MTETEIRAHFERERHLLRLVPSRDYALDVDAITAEFVDRYGTWDPDMLDDDVYGALIAKHLIKQPAGA